MESSDQRGRFFYPMLFLFLGMAGVVAPYLTQRGIPGDLGDTRFNSYLLEHAFLALSGKVDSFLSAPFFYPWLNVVGLSDTHWGTLPFYAVFRWLGCSTHQALSGWFCLGTVLNFFSAYFVSRRLKLSPLGAGLCGFLFAFSLPVIAQDGHLQLTYRFYIPLAFLCFHRYLENKSFIFLGFGALLCSLQFLATFYMGYFLVIFLFAYSGVVCYCERLAGEGFVGRLKRIFLPQRLSGWGIVLLVLSLGVLVFIASPHIITQRLHGVARKYWEIRMMLPRIHSFFLGDRSLLWFSSWRGFASIPSRHEHQLFLGLGATFLLFYPVFSKTFLQPRAFEKRLLLTLWTLVIGTLVVGGVSLYQVIGNLPGASAVRAVTRGVLVCLFPIGLIIGRVVEHLKDKPMGPISSKAVVGALLLFVVGDSLLAEKASSSSREWDKRVKAVEVLMKDWNKESILVVSADTPVSLENFDAMLTAQKLGIKTLNGYSAFFPVGWKPMATCGDVMEVISASETFYRKKFNKPTPLQQDRLVCVGFPEPDPGCRETFLR